MDSLLVWIGIIFIVAAVLSAVYFTFDQERKRIADARRREDGIRD
jgi:hypothetical protein